MSLDDILAEYLHRLDEGDAEELPELLRRNSGHASALIRFFQRSAMFDEATGEPPYVRNARDDLANAPDDTLHLRAASDGHARNGQVLGDYRVLREIGRGGMGVVYEAVQISLDRRVALKALHLTSSLRCREAGSLSQRSPRGRVT